MVDPTKTIDFFSSAAYSASGVQATAVTNQLHAAVENLTAGSARANRALNLLIPAAGFAGMAKFAAVAGNAQEQLDQLKASTIGTSQGMGVLSKASEQLARQFPIGTSGAREMVAAIQSLGTVSDKHQANVLKLGQAFTKLGAATGESGAAIGTAIANLDRSFSSGGLDPKRIESLGNSVVALKNKFGGTASGIAGFAQQISPFARQLGLGTQATLGISASFNKLGADSGAAANAVSKVMSDLSRAVRDGGPQLKNYASLVGMTTDNFKKMAASSPAGALTKVVGALGQPGAQSQRNLDLLGYDGIRQQRPLLQLAQSGGLADAINTAQNPGDNTMNDAAKAAMDGFNTSLTRLKGNADLFAEALGAPVLGPLKRFSDGLSGAIGGAQKIYDDHKSLQKAVQIAAFAGLPLALGKTGIKGAIGSMIAKSTYESSPFAAFRTARQMRQRGIAPGEEGFTELQKQLADEASQPVGLFQGIRRNRQANSRLKALGKTQDALASEGGGFDGFARQVYPFATGFTTGAAPGETVSLPKTTGGFFGALKYGATTGAKYTMYAKDRLQAQTDAMMAPGTNKVPEFEKPVGKALMALVNPGGASKEDIKDKLLGTLQDKLGSFGGKGKSEEEATESTKKHAKGSAEAGAEAKNLAARFKDVGHSLRGLDAGIKSEGLGQRAGLMVGRRYGAIARAGGGALKFGGGLAGEAFQGVAGFAASNPFTFGAGALLAGGGYLWNRHKNAQAEKRQESADLMGSSITQGSDDYQRALGKTVNATTTLADTMYKASKKIFNAADLGTSEGDWHRGTTVNQDDVAGAKDAKKTRTILSEGGKAGAVAQINALNTRMDFTPGVAQLTKIDLLKAGFSPEDTNDILGKVKRKAGQMSSTDTQALLQTSENRAGAQGNLGKSNKKALDTVLQGVAAQFDTDSTNGGAAYANDQRAKRMNQILTQARGRGPNGIQLKDNGQDYVGGYLQDQFDALAPGQRSKRTRLYEEKDLAKPAQLPGQLFEDLKKLPGNIAVAVDLRRAKGAKLAGVLGDVSESSASSQEAAIRALRGSGLTTTQLAQMGANLTGVNAPQGAVATMARQRMEQANISRQTSGGGRQATALLQSMQAANAVSNDDSPEGVAARQAQGANIESQLETVKDSFKQRIMAQIQFQWQSARSNEDFSLGQRRAEEDFGRSRMRSQRDFNKQMKRMNEDAAKSMYDPYRRVAVEAVWDSASLASNLKDQAERLSQQKGDLGKLRKAGLSKQAIEQLSLSDPNHQQEVEVLLSNVRNDPSQIRSLNAAVAQKQKAASGLVSDKGNVGLERSKEDYAQSQKDQLEDFRRGQSRAESDFNKSQGRMREDMRRSKLAINGDMAQIQAAYTQSLTGNTSKANKLLTDDLKTFTTLAKKSGINLATAMNEAVNLQVDPQGGVTFSFKGPAPAGAAKPAGAAGPGSTSSTSSGAAKGGLGKGISALSPTSAPSKAYGNVANQKLGKQMAHQYGWDYGAQWNFLQRLWGQESGWNDKAGSTGAAYGIPQGFARVHPDYDAVKMKGPRAQIAWGLGYIRRTYGDPQGAVAHKDRTNTRLGHEKSDVKGSLDYNNQPGGWYAQGSIFTGARTIGVGEGGPEAVIPLNQRGVDVLSRAFMKAMSGGGMRGLAAANAKTYIHYDSSSTHNDHSVRIAKVEVSPTDTRTFLKDMAEMSRRSNLTKSPTRK